MASSRIKKPEPCSHEDCSSRRFHIGDDGYTYCDRGHQQSERGTVIAEDTGELVTTGRRARKKDSDVESATSKASTSFSGPRAFEHYLLCLQLVLRKQLRWLIDVQKLPEELESLVRDLWALRLQKLQGRVSYDSETDTEGQSQLFSSQSEGETTDTASARRSRARTKARTDGTPNVLETVALCYIGVLLLREPVTVADMHSWIASGDLLYYRASREIPLGMRERLPATYQSLLEPQVLSQVQKLHHASLAQLSMLHADFGMAVPQINSPLILHRWLRELALPIEVFAATQRLARMLNVDMSFTLSDRTDGSVKLRYPEASLMALIVVATKLLFPMDALERSAVATTDLSALSMDWDAWSELQAQKEGGRGSQISLSFGEALTFSEEDVLTASDEHLDQYLNWYEANLASEDIREHGKAGKDAGFRRSLFPLFPLPGSQATLGGDLVDGSPEMNKGTDKVRNEQRMADEATDKLRSAQRTLCPKVLTDSGHVGGKHAGSFYRRFRSATDLEGVHQVFYSRAAGLAGLSLSAMVQCVFAVERKMQKLEEQMRSGKYDNEFISQ